MSTTFQLRFLPLVQSNLTYWHAHLQGADEPLYAAFDPERQNLFQAVQVGLAFPETCLPAAELIVRLIGYLEARGMWRAWMPLLEQARRVMGTDPSTLTCAVLNRLGYFYQYEGQREPAGEAHFAALRAAQQIGARFEEAIAHFGLSEWHLQTYEDAEAEAHCQAGLAILAQLGEGGLQTGLGLNLLGLLAMRRGAYTEAVGRFEAAIQTWPAGKQPRKLSYCYLNLATTFRYQKHFVQAQAALEMCIALLAQTTSRLAQINAELALGTLLFEQEAFGEARCVFEQIDTRFLEQGAHWSSRAHVANNLGNVFLEEGAWAQAEEQLMYAIQLWRQVGDKVSLASSLKDLVACEIRQGAHPTARGHWQEALTLLDAFPENAWARERREELLALGRELEGDG